MHTLDDFDQALLAEYRRTAALLAGQPLAAVQRRFAEYAIFPSLGWALIRIGEAQALAENDPARLQQTFIRFLKCAHACWGHADADGLHANGYDHSALVTTALYSALLGDGYIGVMLGCERRRSVNGYGAFKHAANLMVALQCPHWPHRDKSVQAARAFVAGSGSRTDRAFVGILLGVLDGDRAAVTASLHGFFAGYLKSDWGRHKPHTLPSFAQALVSYARLYLPDAVDADLQQALATPERVALWQQVQARPPVPAPHRFGGELAFLDELPGL